MIKSAKQGSTISQGFNQGKILTTYFTFISSQLKPGWLIKVKDKRDVAKQEYKKGGQGSKASNIGDEVWLHCNCTELVDTTNKSPLDFGLEVVIC